MPFADPHAATLRTLDQLLRAAMALAVVALLSLPAARGHDALLGWMPGWLLGLPFASWAMLRFLSSRQSDAGLRRPAMALRRIAAPAAARGRRAAGARRLRRAA